MNSKQLIPALFVQLLSIGICADDPYQKEIATLAVAQVNEARDAFGKGDSASAGKKLENVISTEPEYYRALLNLGIVYQNQGRNEDALKVLEKAKKVRDAKTINDDVILVTLGSSYLDVGRLDDSEKLLIEALNAPAKDQARVLTKLGDLYFQRRNLVVAKKYLEQAVSNFYSSGARKLLGLIAEFEQQQRWGVEIGFGVDFKADNKADVEKKIAKFKKSVAANLILTKIERNGKYFLVIGRFGTQADAANLRTQLDDGSTDLGKAIKTDYSVFSPRLRVIDIVNEFGVLSVSTDDWFH